MFGPRTLLCDAAGTAGALTIIFALNRQESIKERPIPTEGDSEVFG
jgi:hypothetical protein